MSHTRYQNITITPKESSEIEIVGEIPFEHLTPFQEGVISKLQKETALPGFRKGHVPRERIIQHVGEGTILHESAEQALQSVYPEIIIDHKLDPIGNPQIIITKLAPGNPLGFKAVTAVMPEITLPDYRAIAHTHFSKEKVEPSVEEKEIEDTLLHLRKALKSRDASGEKDAPKESGEQALPEITDALVQTLGDFKNVADFKEKIKENIKTEKIRQEEERRRVAVIDEIAEGLKVTLPNILIEAELNKLVARFKDQISQSGIEFSKYLEQIKKSEDDMRTEMRPDAVKRAKIELALAKIAEKEKLSPDKETVEKEVKGILEHHKDADPHHVRMYVANVLTNQLVLQSLEKEGGKKETPPKA